MLSIVGRVFYDTTKRAYNYKTLLPTMLYQEKTLRKKNKNSFEKSKFTPCEIKENVS